MAGLLVGMLSGCDEQEVGLEFQVSVIDNYAHGHADRYYAEAVRNLLAEQQIDLARVEMWADDETPWVVNLRMPGDVLTRRGVRLCRRRSTPCWLRARQSPATSP